MCLQADVAGQEPEPSNKVEPGPETGAVEAALAAWRRKAADIVLATVAIVHLPVLVIVFGGDGHRLGVPLTALELWLISLLLLPPSCTGLRIASGCGPLLSRRLW